MGSLFPLRIYTALKPDPLSSVTVLCLFPLRIYTALKPVPMPGIPISSLFPLRIYTALKHYDDFSCIGHRLFPLRIYTALKLEDDCIYFSICLFPLRIYTALKHKNMPEDFKKVCFPYEFTLLSNTDLLLQIDQGFVSPTNLHCSQTACISSTYEGQFVSPTNLHCSQTRFPGFMRAARLFPLRIYTALKPQTSNCPRKISAKYLCNIHSLLETLLF